MATPCSMNIPQLETYSVDSRTVLYTYAVIGDFQATGIYLYFNIFLDFLKCWQEIFSHSWVPSLPISWRSNYLGGPMKVVTFGHFPGKVRFKTNYGFPIRSSISYYLSHQCKCLIWSYSLYLSSFLYISQSFHGAETAIGDLNQYLLQVSTENRINSFI